MRCGNCVRRVPSTNDGGYCLHLRRTVDDDWFCADFEPRSDASLSAKLRKLAKNCDDKCGLAEALGLHCYDFGRCGDCTAKCLTIIADEIDKEM